VARLPFTTSGYPTPGPATHGDLQVTLAQLLWGAMTVGATPVALGAHPRPFIEMSWRVAMVEASVEEDPSSGRWIMTDGYYRLDQSEKRAISYFLGMTQAKVTCDMLLGVPHLVHLDAILALQGQTTNRSRPDFVGFDQASMTYSIAVEAKGRARGRTRRVTSQAKAQAMLLPTVVATTSNLRVASVASFDSSYLWEAHLEDPVGSYEESESQTIERLLVAYYRPILATLRTSGIATTSDDSTIFAPLPGIDVTLGLSRAIVDSFRGVQLSGPVSPDQTDSVGRNLIGVISELPGKSLTRLPDWNARGSQEAQNPKSFTGSDGVQVQLGESWTLSLDPPRK
jgi:hypothetical protein